MFSSLPLYCHVSFVAFERQSTITDLDAATCREDTGAVESYPERGKSTFLL